MTMEDFKTFLRSREELFKNTKIFEDGFSFEIKVKVAPGAKVEKLVIDKEVEHMFRCYVTTIAEKGKANKSVINLIAKKFSSSKSSVELISGERSREKLFLVRIFFKTGKGRDYYFQVLSEILSA